MSNTVLKHGQKVTICSFKDPNFKVNAIFCSYDKRKDKDDSDFKNVPKEDCFMYRTKDGFKYVPLNMFYVYKKGKH